LTLHHRHHPRSDPNGPDASVSTRMLPHFAGLMLTGRTKMG
jgi:hypothetical protein